MILWLVLTAMTSIAAVFVAAPFLRDWETQAPPRERDVFLDQLREIELERSRGDIDASSAEAAANEVRRRLLAARINDSLPQLSAKERAFAAIGVAGVVALGSVGLFALTSGQAPMARDEREIAAVQSEPQTPSVEEMARRLERRLKDDPADVAGWRTLGWARLQTNAYRDAAAAYAKAIELQPDAADAYSARAEALIRASQDKVSEEARSALDAALARDPKDARARYWLGVASMQKGDRNGARDIWRDLLSEGAEGDFAAELKRRMSSLDGDAASQPRNDESAMIHSMVDGLERRLSASPADAQGWIRLIKSRMVLGERDKAQDALERARRSFATDAEIRQQIEDEAKEAGLR
ncbi:c-type cytochrome biogenesis protein CcmI [Methylocystis parvus]|uniref:C-type cytochrome biogenesis protein CcmI n=1 Tax=Methylocystis parvus TaxID=134 RepID=A0A6B8M4H0_9HYPH|nr:c-type cytochrome biogenesis protein CcmI [Methylocystis parvus]QGM96659.1 c-type cytochrome biogenesis protein CcmI [Methylocystis parvus]WBJ99482.1 c-type cytochrome biogenesis protein CcmI [Methylocystis parvus OBBP]